MKKNNILYTLSRPLIKVFMLLAFRPKVIGKDNIPKNKKIILVGNHTSIMDPWLLMATTRRQIHFLAKIELFKGFKGLIFNHMGLIPVDRSKKDSTPLKIAKEYLDMNEVVLIFPEGTISKDKMLPFKIGAIKLAKDTNTEIIPFRISGKYRLFNKLKIEFGNPYKIELDDLEKENDKLKNIINKMEV